MANISRHFPASLRDPLKHLTGMHKGIDADLIVSTSRFYMHQADDSLHTSFRMLRRFSCMNRLQMSRILLANLPFDCLRNQELVWGSSIWLLVPVWTSHTLWFLLRLVSFFMQDRT
jgi:hypothetical protein